LLLALDNFEHVLPAAGALADLLANCPRLTLLVTSRIPLHLRWEWTLRLEPLPTPNLHADLPPIETLAEIPSVALFVARAQARRGDFAMNVAQAHLVAQLTAELDGLPLAIELAAARLDVLPLQVIVHRLGDRMRLLRWDAQDVPIRQHSLEAAIGWSYELLSPQEQQLFRCLGVFCGQVSLPSIATVVAAVADRDEQLVSRERRIAADKGHILAGLSSLAEKSLVLSARGQESHGRLSDLTDDSDLDLTFHMLETVREYAWERLIAEGELEVAQQAHAQYFRLLAKRAGAHLRGPDQRVWLLRLEHEHDNLRAALHWGLRDDEDEGISAVGRSEDALRLAADLGYFWWVRGYLAEGSRWLEAALRRAPDADPTLRIQALTHSGPLLTYQGTFDSAKRALEQAHTLAEALAETQEEQFAELARIVLYRGLCAVYAGDVTQSIPLLQEARRRADALEDHHLAGLAFMFLGGAAFAQAQFEQTTALFEESLIHFEMAGDSIFAGNNYVHMGMLTGRRGDLSHAVRYIRKGLEAGIAFEERRLLSVAVQVALSLPVGRNQPEDLAQRAQLLGAVDMLSQATGRTLLQTLLASSLDLLREKLGSENLQALYMRGRSLSFAAVASLASTFLDDLSDALGSRESAPEADSMAAHHQTQPDSLLSPRQRDVLRLVALGLSNKAIGQRLYLSPSTVTYHLSSAFNKLGVDTRAHAVAVATQQGLL
jgi:non-specific serine/threonine protein kinase